MSIYISINVLTYQLVDYKQNPEYSFNTSISFKLMHEAVDIYSSGIYPSINVHLIYFIKSFVYETSCPFLFIEKTGELYSINVFNFTIPFESCYINITINSFVDKGVNGIYTMIDLAGFAIEHPTGIGDYIYTATGIIGQETMVNAGYGIISGFNGINVILYALGNTFYDRIFNFQQIFTFCLALISPVWVGVKLIMVCYMKKRGIETRYGDIIKRDGQTYIEV